MQLVAPLRLAFAAPTPRRLKLAARTNSLTHYTKGTPSPHTVPEGTARAPTARRHPVSGSVSPPSSGCFSPFPHGTGSLSVTKEYLGLEGGPPTFGQGFTCPALLEDHDRPLPLRAFHPLRGTFPGPSGSTIMATGLIRFRSPLLTESRLLSFPPATEMFQFAGFASCRYGFTARYPASRVGCPIRTFRDQRVLAPPPDLSQRATSFVASWCQGIHQMPFSCSPHSPRGPDGPSTVGAHAPSLKTPSGTAGRRCVFDCSTHTHAS